MTEENKSFDFCGLVLNHLRVRSESYAAGSSLVSIRTLAILRGMPAKQQCDYIEMFLKTAAFSLSMVCELLELGQVCLPPAPAHLDDSQAEG